MEAYTLKHKAAHRSFANKAGATPFVDSARPPPPSPYQCGAEDLLTNTSVQTLHSEPYTLHPTPYTLNPKPQTLNPKPQTLNPTPYTLNPGP